MWIRLKKPFALVYPPRIELADSIHSIGTPRARELVADGVAEPTEPLDPEQDDLERLRQKVRDRQGGRPLWDEPQATQSSRAASRAKKRAAAVAAVVTAFNLECRQRKAKQRDASGEAPKSQSPVALLVGTGKRARNRHC
jgi:hypothetical protein